MIYYVAGGAVRDLLLGRALKDVDYIFDAAEEVFIQRNPSARKTKDGDHPIYFLHGQEYSPLQQGPDALLRDLCRRDFTLNALLLSSDGRVHGHPQSFADLKAGFIRPASPTALADDPVRALRAARFAAELPCFRLHEETLAQMQTLDRNGYAGIAAEQAGRETLKACLADRPGNFPRALTAGNCLAPWFQELDGADDIPAGPEQYHSNSVLGHTARIMDAVAEICLKNRDSERERGLAVWMALCHDLGKMNTPKELLPHHHGHEESGQAMAEALGLRLRLPAIHVKAGILASRLHMKAGLYESLRPGTRVDLLMNLHAAHLFMPFCRLASADAGKPELPALMTADLERILAVSLSKEWRDRGAESGRRLRELRCMALT